MSTALQESGVIQKLRNHIYFARLTCRSETIYQAARSLPPASPSQFLEHENATHCRGGRGKKKAVGGIPGDAWDWEEQHEKLIRCLGSSSDIDLWRLFQPRNPDSRLLQKWLQLVRLSQPKCIRPVRTSVSLPYTALLSERCNSICVKASIENVRRVAWSLAKSR